MLQLYAKLIPNAKVITSLFGDTFKMFLILRLVIYQN